MRYLALFIILASLATLAGNLYKNDVDKDIEETILKPQKGDEIDKLIDDAESTTSHSKEVRDGRALGSISKDARQTNFRSIDRVMTEALSKLVAGYQVFDLTEQDAVNVLKDIGVKPKRKVLGSNATGKRIVYKGSNLKKGLQSIHLEYWLHPNGDREFSRLQYGIKPEKKVFGYLVEQISKIAGLEVPRNINAVKHKVWHLENDWILWINHYDKENPRDGKFPETVFVTLEPEVE
jgi:hypothetical protein